MPCCACVREIVLYLGSYLSAIREVLVVFLGMLLIMTLDAYQGMQLVSHFMSGNLPLLATEFWPIFKKPGINVLRRKNEEQHWKDHSAFNSLKESSPEHENRTHLSPPPPFHLYKLLCDNKVVRRFLLECLSTFLEHARGQKGPHLHSLLIKQGEAPPI